MLLDDYTNFHGLLPFFSALTPKEIEQLDTTVKKMHYTAGSSVHNGIDDCTGILVVQKGQLRNYILSEQGKEITLYRLTAGELCVLSASCILKNINFDIYIDAEKDSDIFLIPSCVYSDLKNNNMVVGNFTNELINERFSSTMWVMEQIVFMSFDKRLAIFLLDQSAIDGSNSLILTHEIIARHLGTAREVVTRMLKYFQSEGFISLSRGAVQIIDKPRLRTLAAG